MEDKICKVCGKIYQSRNKYYCSRKCMGMGKQGYKICPVCGKVFKDSARNDTVCCSPKCSHAHRSELHDKGVYDEAVKKMRMGYQSKMDSIAPEDFWNSKSWVICSPTGTVYECRNLLNFIREHQELFDGTVKQAYDGFQKIKATQQGKRQKCPSHSWKGWTLVNWSD